MKEVIIHQSFNNNKKIIIIHYDIQFLKEKELFYDLNENIKDKNIKLFSPNNNKKSKIYQKINIWNIYLTDTRQNDL